MKLPFDQWRKTFRIAGFQREYSWVSGNRQRRKPPSERKLEKLEPRQLLTTPPTGPGLPTDPSDPQSEGTISLSASNYFARESVPPSSSNRLAGAGYQRASDGSIIGLDWYRGSGTGDPFFRQWVNYNNFGNASLIRSWTWLPDFEAQPQIDRGDIGNFDRPDPTKSTVANYGRGYLKLKTGLNIPAKQWLVTDGAYDSEGNALRESQWSQITDDPKTKDLNDDGKYQIKSQGLDNWVPAGNYQITFDAINLPATGEVRLALYDGITRIETVDIHQRTGLNSVEFTVDESHEQSSLGTGFRFEHLVNGSWVDVDTGTLEGYQLFLEDRVRSNQWSHASQLAGTIERSLRNTGNQTNRFVWETERGHPKFKLARVC